MRVGVIADTHDNLAALRTALGMLREHGAELILHAGDFVSPFVALPFAENHLRVIGVFGNNDGDKLYLRERFSPVGQLHFGPHELELGGRSVLLMHEPRALAALAASGHYHLIVYGHTHEPDLRPGPPLILNPGECGGWLSGRSTCAVVDLASLQAHLLPI